MEQKISEETLKGHIELENKLLYNPLVVDYLKENFGPNSIKIIEAALEETTDDAIAARCKLKVAEVRAILNKLYNYRLADYKRIKDRDTGWFSYIWKIDITNVLNVIKNQTSQKIDELDEKIEVMNTSLLYYCPKCSKTNLINFDLASEMMFRCPSCENKLVEKQSNEKEDYEIELNDLKNKHSALLEDINRFMQWKAEEEKRIKEMREMQEMEMTLVEKLNDEKKRKSNISKSKKSNSKIKNKKKINKLNNKNKKKDKTKKSSHLKHLKSNKQRKRMAKFNNKKSKNAKNSSKTKTKQKKSKR